jgi:hypothetical protein
MTHRIKEISMTTSPAHATSNDPGLEAVSRDASGGWSDVIECTSMDDALAAAEAVMQDPAFALFGTMIDPDTVQMRHAPIRPGHGANASCPDPVADGVTHCAAPIAYLN